MIGKTQNNLKLDRRTCKGPCNIGFFSRLAKLTMIILCTVLCVSAAPTVINFDNLVTGGWGTGGPIPVTNQYSAQGVTFNSPKAIDFSKGIAIPGFAHSGTIAIEQCYSAEFCSTPIEMKFNQPQSRVKVWVGIDTRISGKQEVTLRAFNSAGTQIAQDKRTIDPSAGPVPIQTSLQVVSSSNPKQKALTRSSIVRATVSFSDQNAFTNGLAVDDVEFENTGILTNVTSNLIAPEGNFA
jgi:hypothetical protein